MIFREFERTHRESERNAVKLPEESVKEMIWLLLISIFTVSTSQNEILNFEVTVKEPDGTYTHTHKAALKHSLISKLDDNTFTSTSGARIVTLSILEGEDHISKVRDFCHRAAASHDRWRCSQRILSYTYGRVPELASSESNEDFFEISSSQAQRLLSNSYDYMLELMNDYCEGRGSQCSHDLRTRLGFPSDIEFSETLEDKKIVVMSTPIFQSTTQYAGSQAYEGCRVNNCINTYDISFADRAKAFFFFCTNMPLSESELSFERRSDQLYLYACNESPLSLQTTRSAADPRNIIMPFMNDKFNLTMGYKTVSSLANTWYFNPSMGSYAEYVVFERINTTKMLRKYLNCASHSNTGTIKRRFINS